MWKVAALALLLFSAFDAQSDDAFGKYYRNAGQIHSIVTVPDGFVVLADHYNEAGRNEVLVMKLLPTGKIVWKRAFRSAFSLNAAQMIATSDGGFAITGNRYSSAIGPSDVLLMKLNSAGNLQWSKKYFTFDWESGSHIIQMTDGGFLIAIGDGYDLVFLRVDRAGNPVWTRSWEAGFPESIELAERNGQVLSATIQSDGLVLLQLNAKGQITHMLGVKSDPGVQFTRVALLPDGGYAVTGRFYPGNWEQMFVARLNQAGKAMWIKAFTSDGYMEATDIVLTAEGDLAIAGNIYAPHPAFRVFLLRLSLAGKVIRSRSLGKDMIQAAGSLLSPGENQLLYTGLTDFNNYGNNWAVLFRMDSDGVADCSSVTKEPLNSLDPPSLFTFDPPLYVKNPPEYIVTAPEIQAYNPAISGQFLCK